MRPLRFAIHFLKFLSHLVESYVHDYIWRTQHERINSASYYDQKQQLFSV